MKATNNIYLFENAPIPKAVFKLALPTIVSQLITMIYNLADTFFVGQMNDPDQSAAVALAFPAFMTLNAIVNLFGIGGGSLISRSIGEKNIDRAKKTSTLCIYSAIIVTLIYSLAVFILKEPFGTLLGTSPSTADYTQNYLFWVLVVGGLPTVLNVLFGHLVRSEGNAKAASIGICIGGVLNIILDPIFILPFGFNLEIAGAAIATMISNLVSTAYFVIYLLKNKTKSVITLSPRHFTFDKHIAYLVISTGLPAAFQTFLAVISNTVLNNLMNLHNEAAVAAAGIVKKIDMLPMNVTMGLSQGVLPIIGYNYGKRDYERMHKANKFARLLAVSFSLFCIVLFEIFAEPIVTLFIKDPSTALYGTHFLRVICLSTPCMAISFLITTMFQSTGQSKQALALSIFRKGAVDVPLFFLFDKLYPIYGLMWTQPVVDTASIVLALFLYRRFVKKTLPS